MSSYKAYYESQAGGSYQVFRGGMQSGGGYPVFRGGIQTGAGLGDILRGLFRAIVPVAKQGIASLAKSALLLLRLAHQLVKRSRVPLHRHSQAWPRLPHLSCRI